MSAINDVRYRAESPQDSYTMLGSSVGVQAAKLRSWATIRRLEPACELYRSIQLYIANSCGSYSGQILNIYAIDRKNERTPFPENIYRMLLWHGTSAAAVGGIIETGFRLGVGGLYGGGIYFADRVAKSAGYVTKTAGGRGYLIIAEVDLGKVYKAHHIHSNYTSAPPGFHSVKGNGKDIPKWKDNRKYKGAVLPCGPTVPNTRHPSFDLAYNEYIVYDPQRIIVKFLVEFQFGPNNNNNGCVLM